MVRQPMGVEIRGQQSGLEEDQGNDPDGGRSAEDGQELLGRDGLDEEEQKRREKDSAAKKQSQLRHAYPQASLRMDWNQH